jgi:conjugative relaxase-like TrwC/TraI family protein
LWAVADPAVAAVIERAHEAAVKDALAFIEKHALFTRTGPQGVRQVNVRGLVAAAFAHRDSRAGDPDLHTHVAVANKVQTLDGRWLSIDGRVLFKANVAASETYNTGSSSSFTWPWECGSPNGPAPTRASDRSGRSSVSTID